MKPEEAKSVVSALGKVTKILHAASAYDAMQGAHTLRAYKTVIKPIENVMKTIEDIVGIKEKSFSTRISVDLDDGQRAFDAIALARVCAMATHSLDPETFNQFAQAHNLLIETRVMQNDKIV
jgi:hypothetical protein